MADKEERIVVLSTKGKCNAILQEGCHIADSCSCCNVGMTKSDTVKKIAKAICGNSESVTFCGECPYKNTEDCNIVVNTHFLKQAEAALNALLGVEK